MRFFLSGGIAMILSWLFMGVMGLGLTGCRLGNYLESADKVTGFYRTAPSGITFYAEVQTDPAQDPEQRYGTAPGSELPADMAAIFKDPVGLMVLDLRKTDALFFNPDDSRYQLPTEVTQEGKISSQLQYQPMTFWEDPACVTEVFVFKDGILKKQEKSTVSTATGGVTVSGRLEMALEKYIVLTGTCDATLQDLLACYQDRTTCGGADDGENEQLQAVVREFFAPYINTGVFTEAEILNLKLLAYTAEFR